jgi:hypothetical protein
MPWTRHSASIWRPGSQAVGRETENSRGPSSVVLYLQARQPMMGSVVKKPGMPSFIDRTLLAGFLSNKLLRNAEDAGLSPDDL